MRKQNTNLVSSFGLGRARPGLGMGSIQTLRGATNIFLLDIILAVVALDLEAIGRLADQGEGNGPKRDDAQHAMTDSKHDDFSFVDFSTPTARLRILRAFGRFYNTNLSSVDRGGEYSRPSGEIIEQSSGLKLGC